MMRGSSSSLNSLAGSSSCHSATTTATTTTSTSSSSCSSLGWAEMLRRLHGVLNSDRVDIDDVKAVLNRFSLASWPC